MVKVDVRIFAATNIDVPQAIASGKLREDLYYRLNAFTIMVPPLRERTEEIPILLRHFMSKFADMYMLPPLPLSPQLVEGAVNWRWPGNVRELENFVKRFLILGDEASMLKELQTRRMIQTSSGLASSTAVGAGSRGLKGLVRDLKGEAEMEAIKKTLDDTNWNRKQAARILKISYKALLYKIREYGLEEMRAA